jgi:small-conductance mechanosensitive channel
LTSYELINPATLAGALFYGVFFLAAAALLARFLQLTFHRILKEDQPYHFDNTLLSFLSQFSQIAVYVIFLILYAHLIPYLYSIATAMLASASVVYIMLGLAAQNTLGNLVAVIALLLYRPFGVVGTIEVTALSGHKKVMVERILLGHTVLKTAAGWHVMVPHSAVMNQTTVKFPPTDRHFS